MTTCKNCPSRRDCAQGGNYGGKQHEILRLAIVVLEAVEQEERHNQALKQHKKDWSAGARHRVVHLVLRRRPVDCEALLQTTRDEELHKVRHDDRAQESVVGIRLGLPSSVNIPTHRPRDRGCREQDRE